MASLLNRSGLTPADSKQLPTRVPNQEESKVLNTLKQLYTCDVTPETYLIYTKEARFHDPVGLAIGVDLIKPQFNALPKIFTKATIDKFNVLENPAGLAKNTILIDQDVTYYLKASPTKTINSLLTLERNEDGLITCHTEEWNHDRETDSSDGFMGKLNEIRKIAAAKLVGVMINKDASKIRR